MKNLSEMMGAKLEGKSSSVHHHLPGGLIRRQIVECVVLELGLAWWSPSHASLGDLVRPSRAAMAK